MSFHSRSVALRKKYRGQIFSCGGRGGPIAATVGERIGGHTLLQRLQTLKGDLEDVRVGELGGVVDHVDPEQGDDRHVCDGWVAVVFVFGLLYGSRLTKTVVRCTIDVAGMVVLEGK